MALEEIVKVKLHFVEEITYDIIPDLYHYDTANWVFEKPVCFSSRENAEAYRIKRGNEICSQRYHKYSDKKEYSEYVGKHDDCNMRRLAITSRQVSKDNIVTMGNKQYYYDKKEDKMYEIHDKIVEKTKNGDE
ncbi:MAG: hypothetical protein ACP5NW_02550 [Candidatus Woesearchaeota archaeon]